MTLQSLFDGDFDGHFASVRDTPFWLFVHVPKTAGSSLASELADALPPYFNIHIDHKDTARPAMERFDEAVTNFLALHAASPFKCGSGHIQNRHQERISAAIPGTRLLTVLRRPIDRIVSDFRYQRTSMHPLAEMSMARTPAFDSFIDLPGQQNRAAKHLVPMEFIRKKQPEKAIAYMEERYAFVGLQEQYALSFRALMAMLGHPRAPKARQRVNAETEETRVEVTDDLRRAVAERNVVDIAIYDHFSARFSAMADALKDYVVTLEPVPAD